jgi:hypothetical protein
MSGDGSERRGPSARAFHAETAETAEAAEGAEHGCPGRARCTGAASLSSHDSKSKDFGVGIQAVAAPRPFSVLRGLRASASLRDLRMKIPLREVA